MATRDQETKERRRPQDEGRSARPAQQAAAADAGAPSMMMMFWSARDEVIEALSTSDFMNSLFDSNDQSKLSKRGESVADLAVVMSMQDNGADDRMSDSSSSISSSRGAFNTSAGQVYSSESAQVINSLHGGAFDRAIDLIKRREGFSATAYRDAHGHSIGYGHFIRPGENFSGGISRERAEQLLRQDVGQAYNAASAQAAEAHITDPNFVAVLTSVNYQLGTGWTRKFPQTWDMIKDGNYQGAIHALEGSLWNRQTANRVDDFQNALANLDRGPAPAWG
ncbi:MAG: glycoside hydrolase family protein [Pseudobdellovibrionaceae bacterium]